MDLPHDTVMIVSPTAPGTYLTQGYFGKKKKKQSKKKCDKCEKYPKGGFNKVLADIKWRGD